MITITEKEEDTHTDVNGIMQTGWVYTGGDWYYMESSGAMATGWKEINGQWELFNERGLWLYVWQE